MVCSAGWVYRERLLRVFVLWVFWVSGERKVCSRQASMFEGRLERGKVLAAKEEGDWVRCTVNRRMVNEQGNVRGRGTW